MSYFRTQLQYVLLQDTVTVCLTSGHSYRMSYFARPCVLHHKVTSEPAGLVGIAIRPRAVRYWFRIPVGTTDCPLLLNVQTVSEAQPASYSVGTRGYFPWVKRQGIRTLLKGWQVFERKILRRIFGAIKVNENL
jgi:hypothetical protein